MIIIALFILSLFIWTLYSFSIWANYIYLNEECARQFDHPIGWGTYEKALSEYYKYDKWTYVKTQDNYYIHNYDEKYRLSDDGIMFDSKIMLLSFTDYYNYKAFIKQEVSRELVTVKKTVTW